MNLCCKACGVSVFRQPQQPYRLLWLPTDRPEGQGSRELLAAHDQCLYQLLAYGKIINAGA